MKFSARSTGLLQNSATEQIYKKTTAGRNYSGKSIRSRVALVLTKEQCVSLLLPDSSGIKASLLFL